MADLGLKHFSASEFPAGVLEYMEPAFLYRLDAFRTALGCPIHPSPKIEGWVRETGNPRSRHFVGSGRQSDAGDVFCDADPFYCMATAIRSGFTGIGLYFDTHYNGQERPMLHLDTRPGGLVMWVRRAGEYETIFPRPKSDILGALMDQSA